MLVQRITLLLLLSLGMMFLTTRCDQMAQPE